MTVDLNTAEAGDEAEFRCGGMVVIKDLVSLGDRRLEVGFEGYSVFYEYHENGVLSHIAEEPFDIITIHKKPFDWADVKAGMAFTSENYAHIMHYVGKPVECLYADDGTVFVQAEANSFTHRIEREYLTRCPSHDIEVK